MSIAVVILAAGHGTRMQSKRQKVLHEVGGKPMVQHVFDAGHSVADLPPVLVVGPGEEGVRALLGEAAVYVEQAERLGTGHATLMARPVLVGRADQVFVVYADMPLLRPESLRRLAQLQAERGAPVALLTVTGEPGSSFGRVLRNEQGEVEAIVEVANARRRPDAATILALREHNPGVYCFEAAWLWSHLESLPLRQARQGHEYYLTDLIALAREEGRPVAACLSDDPDEGLGAGTRAELALVEKAFRRRTNARWLAAGVTLVDPDSTFIDTGVIIGQDTVIWPGCVIRGRSVIGADCVIGPFTVVRDARLGDGCRAEQAHLAGVSLPPGTVVPPLSAMIGDA